MDLRHNEWMLFEVAARQTAVLDEVLKEVGGYAKIELNGNDENACMDIIATVPHNKFNKAFWFKHIYFYQGDDHEDRLQFRASIDVLGDLITEVKAKIPTWKEELGIV